MCRSFIGLLLTLLFSSTLLSQDTFDLSLYALNEDGTSATALFTANDESSWFDSGDFSFTSAGTKNGSWFGVSWGPVKTRFAMGRADDDYILMKSISFGDMLIGGAFQIANGTGSRYFVAGCRNDAATPNDDQSEVADVSDEAESDSEGAPSDDPEETAAEDGESSVDSDADTSDADIEVSPDTVPPVEIPAGVTQQDVEAVAESVQALVGGNN